MDNIRKNRIIRLSISTIGLFYLANMQFQISFTPLYSILLIVGLVVLQVYLNNHIITNIVGVICGIVFLIPVILNFNLSNLIPVIVDTLIGVVLLGVYGYQLLKYKKS